MIFGEGAYWMEEGVETYPPHASTPSSSSQSFCLRGIPLSRKKEKNPFKQEFFLGCE